MEPLKNLYSKDYIRLLADTLTIHVERFDKKAFIRQVMDSAWEGRPLKDRMRHITITVSHFVPREFPHAINVLLKIRPFMLDLKYIGFANIWFSDFVEVYGLDDPERSFRALEYFTQDSSAEFAIRPFIVKYPERAMEQMAAWAEHTHDHVRRLASEGCRPRLPWGMALEAFKKDPAPIILVLEKLKRDPSEYVRRSVANNLNDIAKDHPDIVLRIAKQWRDLGPETDSLIKHACRTLLKRANATSLSHFGLKKPKGLIAKELLISPRVAKVGGFVQLATELTIPTTQKLRIEFVVSYVKSGGKASDKVFQISEKQFSAGSIFISKKLSLENRTTRKHYPGKHWISIRVNGAVVTKSKFLLKSS